MKEELFFDLIRVSIGNAVCLSHTPSAEEWKLLYEMAKKQSLVGVCFAGVQRLASQHQSPPETLYLQWMGMAAKIQQRNEVMNTRCMELKGILDGQGFRSVVLKGQAVASLYNVNLNANLNEGGCSDGVLGLRSGLGLLRQSGDIDVWVLPDEGATFNDHFRKVMTYAKTIGKIEDFNRQHVCVPFFSETEVEVHFTPSLMNDPIRNKRLQRWFREQVRDERLEVSGADSQKNSNHSTLTTQLYFNVPSVEFNIIYLLQHCYNHLLFEGVGLRQIMDYYFVLVNTNCHAPSFARVEPAEQLPTNYSLILSRLGLLKFAGAMMWVIAHVFAYDNVDDNDNFFLGIKPNEKEGRFLLNEIMNGGNFGKYGQDGIMEAHAKGKVAFLLARMRRNMRMLTSYPREVIWLPFASLKDYFWKLNVKY